MIPKVVLHNKIFNTTHTEKRSKKFRTLVWRQLPDKSSHKISA